MGLEVVVLVPFEPTPVPNPIGYNQVDRHPMIPPIKRFQDNKFVESANEVYQPLGLPGHVHYARHLPYHQALFPSTRIVKRSQM